MNYTIKIADINDPEIDLALRNLIKRAYNADDLIPEKFLAANIESNASKPSFFLVAEEDNKIIGCNAFIANDFILNEINYLGYQSCWSVTDPQHQGKGVFTNLINEAKRILKADGAGFLYGIANNRSNPIITKKLGFIETDSRVLRILNLPFVKHFYLTKHKVYNMEDACVINEEQVREQKLMQFPFDVKTIKYNGSWLWGKLMHKKKFGIKWPVFYVGGIHVGNKNDLKALVSLIFKLYPVIFVQFFSCKTNTFNILLKGWKKPNMNGFIYFNLNMPVFTHFNVMIGAIDIF